MHTSKRMAATTALVMLKLTGCAASGSIDRPPRVPPHNRIVATPDGFAIERIEADGSADAPAPLVPLGSTIRLDTALLGSPSPSPFRSTLHAPSLQNSLLAPIGNEQGDREHDGRKHDGDLRPDERGSANSGKSAAGDGQ